MKLGKKGFTMVELLIVLIILGILVAVATPMYLANVARSRASEAVAMMGTIRQAERETFQRSNVYTAAAGAAGLTTLGIPAETTQYFSRAAYDVVVPPAGEVANFAATGPAAQNFLITVDGSVAGGNATCGPGAVGDCAVHGGDVAAVRMQMDNSGRVFVSYDAGVTYNAW